MKKVVIGLSGGMDSATLLGLLLEEGYEVHCCVFNYGSKHNKYENESAKKLIIHYSTKGSPIHAHFFNLKEVFRPFESNLLLTGGAIPEGHYEDISMKKTVVPGRNMIFASIMAGLAESLEAEAIGLGVHSGDHAIYPDCRPEFIMALNTAIFLSSDKTIQVLTPFIKDDKSIIITKGISLYIPVPYHLTRTCYKEQKVSCGKCGSCQERLEAFSILQIKDPINYVGNKSTARVN